MEILVINGKEKKFQANQLPATVSELLEQLKINAATVVAEIDGQIIERKDFANTTLKAGQKIELIKFMPGG
ncbi:MAG: sulfur carrier protein ThiS [Planctomycetota bacterium]|jgi:sulfur carrier protein